MKAMAFICHDLCDLSEMNWDFNGQLIQTTPTRPLRWHFHDTTPFFMIHQRLLRIFLLLAAIQTNSGWVSWKSWMTSSAWCNLSSGSHISSLGPYSFQLTKYCFWCLHVHLSLTSWISYSSSPSTSTGRGGGSICLGIIDSLCRYSMDMWKTGCIWIESGSFSW